MRALEKAIGNEPRTDTRPARPRVSLAPPPTPPVEEEVLEILYGGAWDCFDSDDIDALRASGTVWLPR